MPEISKAQAKCHLFVLLARRASVGVIFRRGPGTWTQALTWDTKRDTFEGGQWLHGRLYERRCDVSPSGDKMIYFVAKHHIRKVDPSYTSCWTAVSRPPFFTALALWPNAGTTYHGGGLFEDDNDVLVNSVDHRWSNPDRLAAARVHPDHQPPTTVRVSSLAYTSGDQIFPRRLVRDGWTMESGGDLAKDNLDPSGRLVRETKSLRLHLTFGYRKAEYSLSEKRRGQWTQRALEGVEWADFDQQGRLVFAKEGSLLAVSSTQVGGELATRVLMNFNGHRPTPMESPLHARRW